MNRLLSSLLVAFFVGVATSTPAADRVTVLRTPNGGAVPDAEMDASGVLHLAYVRGEDVFYVKSSDTGKTFGEPLRVNSDPGTSHPPNAFRGPDLALGKDGTIHVIWYGNGYQRKLPQDQWGVFYSRLPAGARTFSPAQNLNHRPSDNYSLAADARGHVAVFWMAGGLYVNQSDDNGMTFGLADKIEIADTCECCASRALYGADGTLFCAYRDKAQNIRDMFLVSQPSQATHFTRAKVSTEPWSITGCPMTGAYLSPSPAGLVMAYETKGKVGYSRLNPDGTRVGINEVRTAATIGHYPVVLSGTDDSILASWKQGTTLCWQLFDAQDQPVGVPGSADGSEPTRHAGAVTRDSRFLLIH